MENRHRESEIRNAMARHVFHNPGAATDAVSKVILYAAGLLPELPAEVEQVVSGARPPSQTQE
jgi:hypothetical protein